MFERKISKPRKIFRYVLLLILAMSFGVFAFGVAIKTNHNFKRYIVHNYTQEIINLDVIKYETLAKFQDTKNRHDTALELIQLSFFSDKYGQSGLNMLKKEADTGYAPSQHMYGKLLSKAYPDEKNQLEAFIYLKKSANQGYNPAILSIAELKNDFTLSRPNK